MKTYGDLFTGFGGSALGARQAGYTVRWGAEWLPDVAAVANDNLGDHVRIGNVLDARPSDFEPVDHFHASPPCPNFSTAKAGGEETENDLALAHKVADFITALAPRSFTLENVWAYHKSRSWRIIEDALMAAGFWISLEHVNAADFGVPQTRKRMIVRAARGQMVPYLPPPVRWVGWYEAIRDLIPTLPLSQFAPWQLARLPEEIGGSFYTVPQQSDDHKEDDGFGYGCPRRESHEPSLTVTTMTPGWFKAFLIGGAGNTNLQDAASGEGVRTANEPSMTITTLENGGSMPRAYLVDGDNGRTEDGTPTYVDEDHPSFTVRASRPSAHRAWLSTGRVVAMTPRALARFQSFPDTFVLPTHKTLASYGIGNAVPPLLMRCILESF
jgi:DNA (cytosine-5)-methyltransferase 1